MAEKNIQSEDYISISGISLFVKKIFRLFFRGIGVIPTISTGTLTMSI